jgi:predicted transcriptional regulator of viral defense system
MEARARAYVEGLLASGRHTFTRVGAEAALKSSPVATYHSLRRLQKHGWVAMPRRGFYLVVDPEHRQLGAQPPTAWIDDLMRFHGVRYYVGLLSAAAMHGAADQQPQELQVVAGSVLRRLTVGRVRIRFFFRRRMDVIVTEQVKTSSGYIPVSTPEMTAFDLVRYRKGAGSIDHIATVLAELGERLDAKKLLAIAQKNEELPVIQRLGYLLERNGNGELAAELAKVVRASKPKMIPLEPKSSEEVSVRDVKWHVLVNSTLEVEE